MHELGREEFADRIGALMRAHKIFVPHIAKSINVAFKIYQAVLAERERELFLSTMHRRGQNPARILRAYRFPDCPKCGARLLIRNVPGDPGSKENQRGYHTCWYCLKDDCIYEKYSQRTVHQWMKHLKRKTVKEASRNGSR